MLRTHTCGELRQSHIGSTVSLCGWVDTIRDHGGVIFIDLRDQYGITQVVFHNQAVMEGVGTETVIRAVGTVMPRENEAVNEKLATGSVEVHSCAPEILGPCKNMLPFEIDLSHHTREEIRLKYRYLDLRNEKLHSNILMRSKIISFLRSQMEALGFVDLQTPILTSSSPEGARDYLVPSRVHAGEFYALPQSPQQFKQLLMVAGFDKYYQIAPCFRDEDARGDRSPGEFYQLDFEMAFATQEDIFQIGETVLYNTFKAFTNKKVSPAPFRRISFADSMLHYGTDKPDLRNPLVINDLTDFFATANFPLFKGKAVRGIVANCSGQSRKFFDGAESAAIALGMKGLGYLTYTEGTFKGPIAKFLTPDEQAKLILEENIKSGDTIFFICDSKEIVSSLAGGVRRWLGEELALVDHDSFEFCYIVDFPMYEYNVEERKIDFTHNPFSMPQGGLEALNTLDPLDIFAYQYDIVCNGIELSSGAVRNHSPEIMRKAFEIAGYGEEEIKTKFGAMYTAFQYGAPPHAGMAPGVDRIVMLLCGEETIRDVIAFPLNGSAQDLMMGAPSPVTDSQLRDAHIYVSKI
ncbi:MAG: aspartate--tRNA ligase [Oscillospiraceae bacterium]